MNTGATPVHPATGWFKSTFSNPSHSCVEVAFEDDFVHIRDSKHQGIGPVITIGVEHWRSVLAEVLGLAAPDSNSAVRILVDPDGSVQIQALDSNVILGYTRAEWEAFAAGVAVGEFDRPQTAISPGCSHAA